MASKNCPKCGMPLSAADTVCPNCGFSLKAVRALGASDQETTTHYNLDAQLPKLIKTGLTEDLNPQQIADYKQSMGFADRTDNIVFAQGYPSKQPLAMVWDVLIADSFILSFENDGILFIGLGKAGQFTGNNAFLSDDQIREFDFRLGFGKRVITIRSIRGLIKLACPTTFKWNSLQKQNLMHLSELTDIYNRWVDERV